MMKYFFCLGTDPFNALQRVEREFMLVVEDNTPRQ